MNATTRVIAPSDFPRIQLDFAERSSRIDRNGKTVYFAQSVKPPVPKVLCASPNAFLLWQRYMPAHERREESQPGDFGVDVPPLRSGLSADTSVKDVDKVLKHWAGYGALSWFVATAGKFFQHQIAVGPNSLLAQLAERRRTALRFASSDLYTELEAVNHWRAAVGLGNSATFENSGASWHHTYGFPILPGSGLKGLTRHYFEQQFIHEPAGVPGELLAQLGTLCPTEELAELIFGRSAGKRSPERDANDSDDDASDDTLEDNEPYGEGVVAFHDGWPVPTDAPRPRAQPGGGVSTLSPEAFWFDVDVLTVHHPAYYDGTANSATSTEGPNPVHFLTLRPGVRFNIPLAITGSGRRLPRPQQQLCLLLTAQLLRLALAEWGVGAKTGAGYGRMHVKDPAPGRASSASGGTATRGRQPKRRS